MQKSLSTIWSGSRWWIEKEDHPKQEQTQKKTHCLKNFHTRDHDESSHEHCKDSRSFIVHGFPSACIPETLDIICHEEGLANMVLCVCVCVYHWFYWERCICPQYFYVWVCLSSVLWDGYICLSLFPWDGCICLAFSGSVGVCVWQLKSDTIHCHWGVRKWWEWNLVLPYLQ